MGCSCFSKLVLFILNFIVFGIGTAVIVVASLVLSHSADFSTLLHSGAITASIVILLCGVFVMLLGFFGCFGALRESACLLNTYAIIVLVLVIAQIGAGIYAGIEKNEFKDKFSGGMIKIFDNYGGKDADLTKAIDNAQHSLKCCGVFDYTDWYNKSVIALPKPLPKGEDVSIGCCINEHVSNCAHVKGMAEILAKKQIYTQGCFTKYDNLIEGKTIWLIVGAVLLALVQLGCVFIACGLARSRRRESMY